ncbi:MAG: alanine--glyoxylate aminotransferase family protein [Bdellovibrionales bacterium]|nr:alanine--glyoxylate aminotransferase family protein [Bdellovibrionales bacterium]
MKLFTPGPTPVPLQVNEAVAAPMIHHRSPEFSKLFGEVRSKLADWMGTKGPSLIFSSSGTGAMEAAAGSLFSPKDHVITVESGKFGQRWTQLAKYFDLDVETIEVEWGRALDPNVLSEKLKPETKGVFIQACETSTGVYHPVQVLAKEIKKKSQALFVVDAITALGVHDLDMERDHIDVMIGGSQKALMCPPGLAVMGLRQEVLRHVRKDAGFYFSLAKELKNQMENKTAYTPAVSLIRGLHVALTMMETEGKEAVFARHQSMQKQTRAAFRKMGLELFNRDEDASHGITSVEVGDRFDVKAWLSHIKKEYGLWLAGGQDHLDGRIFRFSHMGAVYPQDLSEALEIIDQSLRKNPFQVL